LRLLRDQRERQDQRSTHLHSPIRSLKTHSRSPESAYRTESP
jgi:hypothetical protein